MRRLTSTVLLTIVALEGAAPALATRVRDVHRGPSRPTVVVQRGFPLHRPLPVVIVRPPRARVLVVPRVYLPPRVFLAPVVRTAAVVTTVPPSSVLAWEASATLAKSDDWIEFTLNVDRSGRKLYLEVSGKAQFEFAEVVFANGEAQVVDFESKSHDTGLYSLLDFGDGRKVDHVRMVARAEGDAAKIVLRMS